MLTTFAALVLASAGLLVGCTATEPVATEEMDPATISEEQLGLTPLISMREVMTYIVDPIVDVVFNAVAYDVVETGLVEIVPETPEDWLAIRQAALTLAESMNLMKMPRPVAPADQFYALNPGELPPAELQVDIAARRDLFNQYADALAAEAMRVVELVDARDVDGVFVAGGAIDAACENCHLDFWYPGDREAVEQFNESEVFQIEPGAAPPVAPAQ